MNVTVSYSGLVSPNHRQRVLAAERFIETTSQVNCPVREFWIPGGYAREISVPAGITLTGAVHKQESIIILSAGHMVLFTEDGPLDIRAPFTMNCAPGAKNIATAIEDCVWTNFFVTDETDPEKIVEVLSESKASELIGGKDNKQLLNMKKETSCLSE